MGVFIFDCGELHHWSKHNHDKANLKTKAILHIALLRKRVDLPFWFRLRSDVRFRFPECDKYPAKIRNVFKTLRSNDLSVQNFKDFYFISASVL